MFPPTTVGLAAVPCGAVGSGGAPPGAGVIVLASGGMGAGIACALGSVGAPPGTGVVVAGGSGGMACCADGSAGCCVGC